MKKINILLIILVLALITITGCAKKEEKAPAKSMEDIYREEGVPVEVQPIGRVDFIKSRTYFSTMEGVKETTQISKVADKIDAILYHVGDYVEKDAVVMRFPETNAMAQYIQVKTQYDNAIVTLNRMQKVYEEGGISKQDLDQLSTQVKVLEATLDNGLAMVEVKAPISGIITDIAKRESDRVFPDDVLFTVSELSRLKAVIWVNEDDIKSVKKGIPAEATWQDSRIKGKVTAVAVSMNPERKAFRTEVEFDNPEYLVKGGVTSEIKLTLSTQKNIVALDRAFVNTADNKYFTWINNNGIAEKRFITIGTVNDLQVEVRQGLSAGDFLITKGYNRVKDGSKLKVLN
ncbi:MAG: efflux RND transporter periplasmic adaptor subunit [Candidatus Cloacimonetes bacterium]|nr:efflux RND transporter periplasmic adaptor subunit [Candidatus Cloacimonadota bacterium]